MSTHKRFCKQILKASLIMELFNFFCLSEYNLYASSLINKKLTLKAALDLFNYIISSNFEQ